jgi:hypothetical protein
MSILLRAFARHLPACLVFAGFILLGTGLLDPSPIVQVLWAASLLKAWR